jgi:hypothetical protein
MAKLSPFTRAFAGVVLGLSWSVAAPAAADDLASLKAELEALKSDYNNRVQALEQRIKALENAANAAPAAPAAAPPVAGSAAAAAPAFPEAAPPAPLPAPAGKSSNATAFNPAISMIITGNYNDLSLDPAAYRIAGFMPPPEGEGPGDRSFNLGESELTVAANVDPYTPHTLQSRSSHPDSSPDTAGDSTPDAWKSHRNPTVTPAVCHDRSTSGRPRRLSAGRPWPEDHVNPAAASLPVRPLLPTQTEIR